LFYSQSIHSQTETRTRTRTCVCECSLAVTWTSGVVIGVRGQEAKEREFPSLNFCLSQNCWEIFGCKIFVEKSKIWGRKNSFWGTSGASLEFWASCLGNLRLSVRILSEFCDKFVVSVRKLQRALQFYFTYFTHSATALEGARFKSKLGHVW